MTRGLLLAGACLALTSTVVAAQRAPESILPPGFTQPAPSPSPTASSSSAPATPRPPASPGDETKIGRAHV